METEDLNLDLDNIESQSEKNLQVKDRFAKLSEKMALTTKEKEEAEGKVKTEADARSKAEKERDFFRDFSQVSSKHPHAAEFQDKILEKVNSGYTTEDATFAVLAKEGKLGSVQPITADTQRPDNIAGGSASTVVSDYGDKQPSQMTQDERRAEIQNLEKQGIDLFKF